LSLASGLVVIERRAARALLINNGSVLLIKGRDPARLEAGTWWLTPGGGIENGESIEDAVVREILEETGLVVPPERVGAIVATRTAEFEFDELHYRQRESFFAIEVDKFVPHARGWDAIEQRALLDHRWWTVDELRSTAEVIYPRELADVVDAVREGSVERPFRLTGA
jgi:8-oxo-dGTP pyrophosphatase MutT (NUDIX family)